MARHTGSVCRLCRRERMKLFLKGDRCFKEKCAIERRAYPPGQHGQRRGRRTLGYGLQLREKQKVKRIYGIQERQFRTYFAKSDRKKGITGENLLIALERRFDSVVYQPRLRRFVARPGAPVGPPWTYRRQTVSQDHHPVVSSCGIGPGLISVKREEPQERFHPREHRDRPAAGASRSGSNSMSRISPARSMRLPDARGRSSCPFEEQLIVELLQPLDPSGERRAVRANQANN